MTPTPDERAALSPVQLRVYDMCPRDDWFAATQIAGMSAATTGSVLTALVSRGIVERRSDPKVWGRAQYRLRTRTGQPA